MSPDRQWTRIELPLTSGQGEREHISELFNKYDHTHGYEVRTVVPHWWNQGIIDRKASYEKFTALQFGMRLTEITGQTVHGPQWMDHGKAFIRMIQASRDIAGSHDMVPLNNDGAIIIDINTIASGIIYARRNLRIVR